MYVAPSIKEHVVELEQGIAAASPTGSGNTSSQINGFGDGDGQTIGGDGS